jgi:putative transposase
MLQPHLEKGRSLRQVAREAGIPYRTAQRWLARYRRYGLGALVRKERDDRGTRRRLSTKMRELVEGLALQKPPVPISALYRKFAKLLWSAGNGRQVTACYMTFASYRPIWSP